MNYIEEPAIKGIKKLQVSETILFAIKNIPDADQTTLKKFSELINTTGTFGEISYEQLLGKMQLMLKYVPDACPHSLLMLADLLEIPNTPALNHSSSDQRAQLPAFQVEPIAAAAYETTVPIG